MSLGGFHEYCIPTKPEHTVKLNQHVAIMAPSDFIQWRTTATQSPTLIDDRPYYPYLKMNSSNEASIIRVALEVLFHPNKELIDELLEKNKFSVKVVTGGITNALYSLSGLSSLKENDSVLIRVFGAEGMIDRDVETSTFAALARQGIAPSFLGRFGNGRLEGWLENYSPLTLEDFQLKETTEAIASEMAKLHFGFVVPEDLKKWHSEEDPGMWGQLFSWMEQAREITEYKSEEDNQRAETLLDLPKLADELNWLKADVIPNNAKVAFCHNDLLAANIMRNDLTGEIKLIDFEYGGVNYVAFDIANHFNEYAGGTSEESNGVPDYSLFPSKERRKDFITAYLRAARDSSADSEIETSLEEDISSLTKEVEAFVLANHLYWGLWAVNQAAAEGTEEFDYLTYAVNRFKRYFDSKMISEF